MRAGLALALLSTSTALVPRRGAIVAGATLVWQPNRPSFALVKGSTPPKEIKAKKSTCSNIDECEAIRAQRQAEIDASEDTSFERTSGGDRYRDLILGQGGQAQFGDSVELRYRVMRLGTRARDGLSGEGQTIFSLGYGEDDDAVGDVIKVQVSDGLVPGVKDAVVGMRTGGKRRVLVRPERGWKDQRAACASITFKADIGAAIEREEDCLVTDKLPQPISYQAKRRFARRFDEVSFLNPKSDDRLGQSIAARALSPSYIFSKTHAPHFYSHTVTHGRH